MSEKISIYKPKISLLIMQREWKSLPTQLHPKSPPPSILLVTKIIKFRWSVPFVIGIRMWPRFRIFSWIILPQFKGAVPATSVDKDLILCPRFCLSLSFYALLIVTLSSRISAFIRSLQIWFLGWWLILWGCFEAMANWTHFVLNYYNNQLIQINYNFFAKWLIN